VSWSLPLLCRPGRGQCEEDNLLDVVTVSIVVCGAMEVFGVSVPAFAGFFTTCGVRAVIAMVWVVVVVDGTAEVLGSVEPGAGSDEDSAGEPLGTVVAVWSAGIGRGSVVAVWALRRYADAYCDLGQGLGRSCYEEAETSHCRCCKDFDAAHWVSPLLVREVLLPVALCGDVIVVEGDVWKRLLYGGFLFGWGGRDFWWSVGLGELLLLERARDISGRKNESQKQRQKSRSLSGMTTRKAKATATAKAPARAKTNTEILRCAQDDDRVVDSMGWLGDAKSRSLRG
jgi:hypothetical protein